VWACVLQTTKAMRGAEAEEYGDTDSPASGMIYTPDRQAVATGSGEDNMVTAHSAEATTEWFVRCDMADSVTYARPYEFSATRRR